MLEQNHYFRWISEVFFIQKLFCVKVIEVDGI
jgi:hypothetical protein